jgi:hypothetical protein
MTACAALGSSCVTSRASGIGVCCLGHTGSFAGTSAGSTRPDKTAGVRRLHQRRVHAPVLLDQHRPPPDRPPPGPIFLLTSLRRQERQTDPRNDVSSDDGPRRHQRPDRHARRGRSDEALSLSDRSAEPVTTESRAPLLPRLKPPPARAREAVAARKRLQGRADRSRRCRAGRAATRMQASAVSTWPGASSCSRAPAQLTSRCLRANTWRSVAPTIAFDERPARDRPIASTTLGLQIRLPVAPAAVLLEGRVRRSGMSAASRHAGVVRIEEAAFRQ